MYFVIILETNPIYYMKSFYLFIALLCITPFYGQKIKTMNKGKVDAKNYSVTIPYQDIRGLVIVEGVINGKTYKFILDTGAVTAISPKLYSELNLPSVGNINVDDSSDIRENMKVVTMPAIHLGGLTFSNIPAVVGSDGPFFQCLGIDGFLGSNFMRNSIVKFSYKTKTITFTDKPGEFNLNKKEGTELLKDKMQSNPHLRIDFNDGEIKGSEIVTFDSGMTDFYDLSEKVYNTYFKDTNLFKVLNQANGSFSLGINGIAPNTMQYRLLLPQLTFAGNVFKNITFTTTSDNGSRIGVEILKYGDVIVDYPGKKLYFKPYNEGDVDLAEKSWPVQPILKEGKFVIGIVWDTTLNDRIQEGDEILKFGEIDYESIQPCEALVTLLRPKNEVAVLKLKDVITGDIKEIEVNKK